MRNIIFNFCKTIFRRQNHMTFEIQRILKADNLPQNRNKLHLFKKGEKIMSQNNQNKNQNNRNQNKNQNNQNQNKNQQNQQQNKNQNNQNQNKFDFDE